MATIITGTGSYIPSVIVSNTSFKDHSFYGEDGVKITTPNEEIVEKFKDITGIYERRYAEKNVNTSDLATKAAALAIKDANIDPETIDQMQQVKKICKNFIEVEGRQKEHIKNNGSKAHCLLHPMQSYV